MSKDKIVVSVCMITYNHEKYISQAIDGVLKQDLNFEIEFIIADDASPDKTKKIVDQYINAHPKGSCIKYTKHNRNKGMIRNFIWALSQCEGKYIALCEGDDYWTDPRKLNKQVSFLEENPEYIISYHDAKIIDESGQCISKSKMPSFLQRNYTAAEILYKPSCILTLSTCFRNVSILKNLPFEFTKVINADTFLFSLLGEYGKGKYHDDIDKAVFRKHDGGIWSHLDTEQKKINRFNTLYWMYVYYCRAGKQNLQKEKLNALVKQIRALDDDYILLFFTIKKHKIINYFRKLYRSIKSLLLFNK